MLRYGREHRDRRGGGRRQRQMWMRDRAEVKEKALQKAHRGLLKLKAAPQDDGSGVQAHQDEELPAPPQHEVQDGDLGQLLLARQEKKNADAVTRAQVGESMARRMDPGVRVTQALQYHHLEAIN